METRSHKKTALLSDYIEKRMYFGRGVKATFEGREWQREILNCTATRRVLKMSRQVGKSQIEGARCVAIPAFADNYKILHVSPSEKQSRKFSQDKVDPIIKETAELKRSMLAQNVGVKIFKNEGKVYIEYAKDNPDRCRGITADEVHYDEVQDQTLHLIQDVIDEVLFTSKHKIRIYAGTPKTLDNEIESRLWQKSDQREFMIACRHHTPVKRIFLTEKNIGKYGPICNYCGKLLDVSDGKWIKFKPENDMAGFHANQLHCKISHAVYENGKWVYSEANWSEILRKHRDYEKFRFNNEVLGLSYDSAEKPFTISILQQACEGGARIRPVPEVEHLTMPRYAGIDWGHGKASTVLVIGQFDPNAIKRFRIIFMKKYEGAETQKEICIPDMARIMRDYSVTRVHADYGGGFGLNDDMMAAVGRDRFSANFWSNSAMAADERVNTSHEYPVLTLNRSQAISNFINKVRKGGIILPAWEDFNPTFSIDFLNIRKEVSKNDEVKYIRTGVDDAVHATLYAYAIARYTSSAGGI